MSLSKSLVFALILISGWSISEVYARGDPKVGAGKAAACAACHGADGNSTNPAYPSLAGQVPGYIASQLADFKNNRRKDPIMGGMAKGLSDKDMVDLDTFFMHQKPRGGVVPEDKVALAKEGEKLYRGGNRKMGISACMGCHGPSGHGVPPRFPRVAGQHVEYLKKQLLAFKAGNRTEGEDIMSRIAFSMSIVEIEAVSQYMHGLQ